MKTHVERVRCLRLEAFYKAQDKREVMKERLKREHTIAITGIFAVLILIVIAGANVPGFFEWLDTTPPIVQILVFVIPMGLFAFWRLRKMLKL